MTKGTEQSQKSRREKGVETAGGDRMRGVKKKIDEVKMQSR